MMSKIKSMNAVCALGLGALISFGVEAESYQSLHPKARGDYEPQKLLFKLKEGVSLASWEKASEGALAQKMMEGSRLGSMTLEKSLQSDTAVLRFSENINAKAAAQKLSKLSMVEWAQPNYYLSIFYSEEELSPEVSAFPSFFEVMASPFVADNPEYIPPVAEAPSGLGDPRMEDLWGMDRVGAHTFWGSEGPYRPLVADIDTGVDYNHEDLRHNIWEGVGYDFASNDPYPFDGHGHGTHTSGTIAALRDNGAGVSGVAPNAEIMVLRFIGDEGYGTTAAAIQSIDYAVENGARILSNSWGGAPDEDDSQNIALRESIERARDADVLFVAAAGNDGKNIDESPMLPAAYDLENIISVASTNIRDRRSFFSNFGGVGVDLGAPGSNILSTMPGDTYQMTSGTSMACPHVAGLAAAILSQRPDLSALEVKEIILDTVDPFPALQGITVTGGLMNVGSALQRARSFGL